MYLFQPHQQWAQKKFEWFTCIQGIFFSIYEIEKYNISQRWEREMVSAHFETVPYIQLINKFVLY